MLLHLEIIRHTGALLLEGPREVNFAVASVAPPRVGSKKCRDTGDEFVKVLEAFEEEMDGVYKSLLKGGVVLDAWKGKKGSNVSDSRRLEMNPRFRPQVGSADITGNVVG